jgi:hypothetical protein
MDKGKKIAYKDELIAIERSLWKNEPDVYHQTYIPEAILIFPEVGRIGRSEAVDAIREENKAGRAWAEVNLDDFKALNLGDETVLLSYRADARWNYEQVPTTILCSTLYVKREGHWMVAFHQQT